MSIFLDGDVLLADTTKQYEEILKNSDNTNFKKETEFVAEKNTTSIETQEDGTAEYETSIDDTVHEDRNKQLIMEERDKLVKDILSSEDSDSVDDLNECIDINTEELGGNIYDTGSKNDLYKKFLYVVTAQNIKVLGEISMGDNMIVKAMNLKNRERGTSAGI